jgi:hypothetical protein
VPQAIFMVSSGEKNLPHNLCHVPAFTRLSSLFACPNLKGAYEPAEPKICQHYLHDKRTIENDNMPAKTYIQHAKCEIVASFQQASEYKVGK